MRLSKAIHLVANDYRQKLPNKGWWMVGAFGICFAILFLIIVFRAYAGDAIAGRASIIDGDTIEIHGQRIRLWGIDAPEGRQRCVKGGKLWRCGTDSANALADYIGTRPVTCTERDRDRYKRIVATCEVTGQDIGAWLVRKGWALDYTRYSDGAYSNEQKQAETEQRGLWQGEFEPPWVWRWG